MSVVVTPGFWNRDSAIAAPAWPASRHILSREWPARLACPPTPLWVVLGAWGVLVDGTLAATYRFRDAPRPDSRAFIGHLAPRHQLNRVTIVPGDRESEVRYLADQVGASASCCTLPAGCVGSRSKARSAAWRPAPSAWHWRRGRAAN